MLRKLDLAPGLVRLEMILANLLVASSRAVEIACRHADSVVVILTRWHHIMGNHLKSSRATIS